MRAAWLRLARQRRPHALLRFYQKTFTACRHVFLIWRCMFRSCAHFRGHLNSFWRAFESALFDLDAAPHRTHCSLVVSEISLPRSFSLTTCVGLIVQCLGSSDAVGRDLGWSKVEKMQSNSRRRPMLQPIRRSRNHQSARWAILFLLPVKMRMNKGVNRVVYWELMISCKISNVKCDVNVWADQFVRVEPSPSMTCQWLDPLPTS